MPTISYPLKVMPMGDSITQGTVPGGYRAPLYDLLTTDGYDISYVGDQNTNNGGGLPANQDNHEGILGDTSVSLKAEIDSTGIIQSSQPNAVLLLIGTNDVGLGGTIPGTDVNIAALLDDIISNDPTVHIFLGTVLHRADDGSGWVSTLNATLPPIVAARAAHVTLVDTASALTVADLDSGGIHPLQEGYAKLATVWNAALVSYYGAPALGLTVQDTSVNQPLPAVAQSYSGPVIGPSNEYISVSSDNLNIKAATPNWFIHAGGGSDGITVSSGTNVLDGGGGSNFLIGGSGADTFYVDDRSPSANVWSSIVNFHSGDNATIWGVTPADFALTWLANQGAAGATGLTGVFVSHTAGQQEAAITLAGYTLADLSNGRLSVSYGTTASLPGVPGSTYMTIHGN
nr:GDSL-type esterase/lipase family protein [uncultured Rhodopila sp.]